MLGINVKPSEENAIQGKSISLQCLCKVSLNYLIATEVGFGGNEELPTLLNQRDPSDWWRFESKMSFKNLYSIKWFWTPKESKVEYDVEQLKNKLAGRVTGA